MWNHLVGVHIPDKISIMWTSTAPRMIF